MSIPDEIPTCKEQLISRCKEATEEQALVLFMAMHRKDVVGMGIQIDNILKKEPNDGILPVPK